MKERYGNRIYRLEDLPYGRYEKKFSDVFHKMRKEEWDAISFKPMDGGIGASDHLSERERDIVASVIQWLGTPVGVAFLEECGFISEEKYESLKKYYNRMSVKQFRHKIKKDRKFF